MRRFLVAARTVIRERFFWIFPRRAGAVMLAIFFVFAAFGAGAPKAEANVVTFLTSGTSFSTPSDWTTNNTIECIGSGGEASHSAGSGGGGGAYAKISALSISGSVTYQVGAPTASTSAGAMINETFFNGAASSTASVSCAFGKSSNQSGAGGTTANSTGTTKFAGGTGSGGGGGAAGPNGAGGNSDGFGDGGNGDAGFGGAGGSTGIGKTVEEPGFPCTAGSPGLEYSSSPTFGAGGGGGDGSGGVGNLKGCDGGSYGAGGGHSFNSLAVSGLGIQGLIIVIYEPPPSAQVLIFGGSVNIKGGSVLVK